MFELLCNRNYTRNFVFCSTQAVLNIAQDDLKEWYKQRIDRIKRYCTTVKKIGSTTRLQVQVKEKSINGIITIQVEAYPLESLAKATQYLVEALCEVIIECTESFLVKN